MKRNLQLGNMFKEEKLYGNSLYITVL